MSENGIGKHYECTCADCGKPGEAVYLHARCHTDAPPWVRVVGDVATLECSECGKKIGQLQLAAQSWKN